MAERAQQRLDKLDIRPYRVKASNTVRRGFPVKRDGDDIIEAAAIGDNAIGIALDAGNGDGTLHGDGTTAPNTIRVAHYGPGAVPCLVGTGGATAGAPAKWASNGLTNATIGGGNSKLFCHGQFAETGVVGDIVGLLTGTAGFTVGS